MTTANLPSQPIPLVGRDRELAELVDLLSSPACRLLTLVGPGGMGKTRLALETAARVAAALTDDGDPALFPDGSYFVPLAYVSSADLMLSAIAEALNYAFYVGGDPRAQLLDYLRDQALLLVLDNFEHLLDAAGLVGDILAAAPRVKVLATSRERMNLLEEWVFELHGLACPTSDADPALADYGAIQLFLQNARRTHVRFALADAQIPALIRICRLVGGMPLGIELASAWVRGMSVEEIADEIERSLDILERPARNVEARHRTMRAAFEPTWNRLSAEDQSVFRKLSVFCGGFTRAAAGAIAGASPRALASLVDRSLLQLNADGRYDLHQLLRQYGREQLDAQEGEAQQVRDLHMAYFADFLQQRARDIVGLRQQEVVREITDDLDNIRTAWWRAVYSGNLAALRDMSYTFYMYCDVQGRYQENTDAGEKAIEHLSTLAPTRERDQVLASLHNLLGWDYIRLGRFDDARAAFHTSLSMYDALAMPPPSGFGAEATGGLALLALVMGNYAEGVQLGDEARRRAQARGDQADLQIALYVLADAHYSQGQYEVALDYARQAYRLAEDEGNRWFSGHALGVLGNIAWALADYDQAKEYYQLSYALKEALNDRGSMGYALNGLGRIAWQQGAYSEATRCYQRGYDLYREVNDPGGIAGSLFGLAETARALGDGRLARGYYQQALEIAGEMHWSKLILEILTGVGEFMLDAGEAGQATGLLALVAPHPVTERPVAQRAQRALARAKTRLSPADFAEASRHGAAGDLQTVARDLHAQLRLSSESVSPLAAPLASPLIPLATSTPPDAPDPVAEAAGAVREALIEALSEREMDVLRLMAAGLSNPQIAEQLVVAIGTVKAHTNNIFGKLGVSNRVQAVNRAQDLNLL